jgi:hypothetical protein
VSRIFALALPLIILGGLLAWEIGAPATGPDPGAAPGDAPGAGTPTRAPATASGPASGPPWAGNTQVQSGEAPGQFAEAARAIVDRPLFSPGRRPPPPPAAAQATAAAGAAFPRLSGVIVGPSGSSAIFTDSAGHARIATEGSPVGEFTIRTIVPGQVTLTSSAGERVLHPSFPKTGGPGAAGSGAGERPAPLDTSVPPVPPSPDNAQ